MCVPRTRDSVFTWRSRTRRQAIACHAPRLVILVLLETGALRPEDEIRVSVHLCPLSAPVDTKQCKVPTIASPTHPPDSRLQQHSMHPSYQPTHLLGQACAG